jgi:hypothetical protein
MAAPPVTAAQPTHSAVAPPAVIAPPVVIAPPAPVASAATPPAPVAPAPIAPAPVRDAPSHGASSTVDLAESGIDLDEVVSLPFQSSPPGAHNAELEGYASIMAELAARPDHRAAVLASRGFANEDAFFTTARAWQARFAADPKLREAFERAVAAKRR